MRRFLPFAALGLALAGCPATNTPDDAGTLGDTAMSDASGLDAPALPDAPSGDADLDTADADLPDVAPLVDAGPDAFECPDRDGDGERDAACGGDDCADDDATLSSALGPCATPTATRRCVDGVAVDIECGGDTPYCDARVGQCVVDACGDGVVHANEVCDTGVHTLRCPSCLQWCADTSMCPAGMVCHPVGTPEYAACTPPSLAGAPDGTPCSEHSECYSAYCDPYQRRCASLDGDCRSRVGFFRAQDGYFLDAGLRTPNVCIHECAHDSECGAGAVCIPLRLNEPPEIVVAGCYPDRVHGDLALGERCGGDTQCQSAVCEAGRCSHVCRDDADCAPPVERCAAVDVSGWYLPGTIPRSAEWSTPWPLICVPPT